MPLLTATVFTLASATSSLEQGELVKFVSGDGSYDAGCGVIWWFAEFEAQRINGDTVRLYLSCPEMAPVLPKVGDICKVTYTIGPIEAVIPRDQFSPHPEGNQMIIEELDCGPHIAKPDVWSALRQKDTP